MLLLAPCRSRWWSATSWRWCTRPGEAARAGAVSTDPYGDGIDAGHEAVTLGDLDVAIEASGSHVRATVRHVVRTDVPLTGTLVPDVRVTATATMRVEP